MKKNRLIFYAVFGIFHVFLVFFTFYMDSNKNDFSFLTQMLKLLSLMKYGAMFGLVLLTIDVVWDQITAREHEKEKSALSHEINTLKAKLFDLQEASKGVQRPVNPGSKASV
jgi:hypothetical protein